MKKNWKKAIALAMTSAMMVGSLSACGNDSTPSNNTTAAPTTASGGSTTAAPANNDATTPAANDVAGIDGWRPFVERVHITVTFYDRSKEGYPAVDDN